MIYRPPRLAHVGAFPAVVRERERNGKMNDTMNALRKEVRKVVKAYRDDNFEETVLKLASIGYRMEEAKGMVSALD